ncbi:MAG: hypothetical protein EOP86_11895, partial [Verrucomicrobiaceae bacterium]
MWKPLSIVSGIALLAAGGISYVMVRPAYVSERLQAQYAEKNLKSAQKLEADAKAAEKKAEADLKTYQATLTKAQSDKAAAVAEKEAALKVLEEAKAAQDAADKELAAMEEQIKGFGNLETMTTELNSLKAKSAEYTNQIEGVKNAISNALAHKASTDKLITNAKRIELWQRSGSMPDNFTSRVTAVNQEWGFVTLAAGNGSSVVNQAKLDVTRGGSVIGRVVVTHVNPTNSVAEIVPGTVAPGDAILPGDRVSVSDASRGSRRNVEAPAPSAPAAPKPSAPAAPSDPFATPGETPAAPADATTPE